MIRLALLLPLVAIPSAAAQTGSRPVTEQTASGQFDVQITSVSTAGSAIGELTLAKTFRGGLQAKGDGKMLAVRTPTDGSAGYVAMETVTGTLAGRTGSFALQHSGTMVHGRQSLSVTVVPDSRTGALAGLTGAMTIRIEGAKHFYTFRYALPR